MFRHQTHPRNVHPYQTTVVPRTDLQYQQSTQQRLKYPWLENPPIHPPPECQSTNSSNSENYQIAHHYSNVRSNWSTQSHSDGLSSPVYHSPQPDDMGRRSPSVLGRYSKPYQGGGEIPTYTLPLGAHESGSSVGGECCESVAGVPPVTPTVSSEVPGGCGGHCPGFEYVCYYVLQIIFVVGILTGVSLCIAGSVLKRNNRGGDLGVLVYIGCLSFMVCSLLLGVQCCVRRSNKQRGKQLRMRTQQPDCIQLDTIPNLTIEEHRAGSQQANPAAAAAVAVRQMQPLLFPTTQSTTSTFPRDYYRSSHRYDRQPSPTDEIIGVPWWRRQ